MNLSLQLYRARNGENFKVFSKSLSRPQMDGQLNRSAICREKVRLNYFVARVVDRDSKSAYPIDGHEDVVYPSFCISSFNNVPRKVKIQRMKYKRVVPCQYHRYGRILKSFGKKPCFARNLCTAKIKMIDFFNIYLKLR